MTKIRGFSV